MRGETEPRAPERDQQAFELGLKSAIFERRRMKSSSVVTISWRAASRAGGAASRSPVAASAAPGSTAWLSGHAASNPSQAEATTSGDRSAMATM